MSYAPRTISGCPATALSDQGLSPLQISLRLGWPPGKLYHALLRSGRLSARLQGDQEQLALQLYARDGLSIDQIIQFLGCTKSAVEHALKTHHVSIRARARRSTLTPAQEKLLLAELTLGELTWDQLGAKYQANPPTIAAVAHREGVRLRGFEHRSRRARINRESHAEERRERLRARERRAMRLRVLPHRLQMAESKLEDDLQRYADWRCWWAEGRTSAWMAAQAGIPGPRLRKMMSYLRQRHGWFPKRQPRHT